VIERILDIPTADGTMGVIVKHPDGEGPFPVVLFFHDGPGLREATHHSARGLADAGFYVASPDRYHRFGRFVSVRPEDLIASGPKSELMQSFFSMVMATTDDLVRADVDALLSHLVSDPSARRGPIGCIGYCNGVRYLLRTMSQRPDLFAAGAGLRPSFCAQGSDVSKLALQLSAVKAQDDDRGRTSQCSWRVLIARDTTYSLEFGANNCWLRSHLIQSCGQLEGSFSF
jgi:dienelactone hydrolase